MPTRPATPGSSPARGAVRCARAGAVAATVVGLAAGAHLTAGGRLPGTGLLLAVVVVVGALSALLAGRRFGPGGLTGLVGGGQVVLHELFGTCSAQTAAVAPHGHHQEWTPLVDPVAGAGAGSAGMTLAHGAATALAVLLLLHGERLLWSLWAWLRPLVRVLGELLRFVAPRPAPFPAATVPRPRSVVARRVRRRGPPRGPALAPTS